MEHFDWFKCRTASKLPGTYLSGFWTTLLLQASLSEPAVLHVVLALSSVHRRGIILGGGQPTQISSSSSSSKSRAAPDKLEQFALRHYIKAISHLQAQFSAADKAPRRTLRTLRVALIACVVFTSLDFLRGHFTAAQMHLENGLKLIREAQSPPLSSDCADRGPLVVEPCREAVDEWIVEAFSRLDVQVELFRHMYRPPRCSLARPVDPGPRPPVFASFREAWRVLERLLKEILHLNALARGCTAGYPPSLRHGLALLEPRQRAVQAELAWWLDTYDSSATALRGREASGEEEKAHRLMGVYHAMAGIMADTCLRPGDEEAFDAHTGQFVHLVAQLTDLWLLSSAAVPELARWPAHRLDMARSIVDMGWVAPLYYAAVKCRVHRVRLQAVRLLESTSHREGIWDSIIAAHVARKIIHLEEGDFYAAVDPVDGFPPLLASHPSPQHPSLPPLPESRRIRDVEVVLAGDPRRHRRLALRPRKGPNGRVQCALAALD